jgi:exonuclease SbcD
MAIRILASGDLHIGRSVTGQSAAAGSFSARDTWQRMVDWAIDPENEIDIMVLTGDIIDWDNRFFEAIGTLREGLKRLADKDIRVFAVAGNHDYDSIPQAIRSSGAQNLQLIGAGGNWEVIPFRKGNEVLQIAGWSFPSRYFRNDPLNSAGSLVIDRNHPCIGLLHGEVSPDASDYAPINMANLLIPGIQAWILGHIHKPDTVRKSDPLVLYPGSPLAFSPKEKGMHGPLAITLTDERIVDIRVAFRSPIRFDSCMVEITDKESKEELLEAIVSGVRRYAREIADETEGVDSLVLDLVLTGSYRNIGKINEWVGQISGNQIDQTEQGKNLIIRELTTELFPLIGKLEELAEEKSVAGFLASVILTIQKEEQSPLVDGLLAEWSGFRDRMKQSVVYSPLFSEAQMAHPGDDYGRQLILREARRLLGMLVEQVRTKQ